MDMAQLICDFGIFCDVSVLQRIASVIVEFLGDHFCGLRIAPFGVAKVSGSNGIALVAGSIELAECNGVLLVPGLGIGD